MQQNIAIIGRTPNVQNVVPKGRIPDMGVKGEMQTRSEREN